MRIPSPIRAAVFGIWSVLAGGCAATGGLGPAPPARPTTNSVVRLVSHRMVGTSWSAAGLKSDDLLYVTNSNGLVSVYRYSQHTLAGVLYDFTRPTGECVDSTGDVYIADYGAETIVEYAHGGAKPIRTINDSPYEPYGCAVDPKTGNLAVANYEMYGSFSNNDTGNIAVYRHATGTPTYYGSDDGRFTSLTYDDYGDLLATAQRYYYYSEFFYTDFYYLPDKATKLLQMDLPNSNFGSGWPAVQSINYDGKYWVVLTSDDLYRYTIAVKAKEIDELVLSGGSAAVGEIWFYRKGPKAMATQLVGGGAEYRYTNSFVGYWNYPTVGNPLYQITTYLDGPFGVAISLK